MFNMYTRHNYCLLAYKTSKLSATASTTISRIQEVDPSMFFYITFSHSRIPKGNKSQLGFDIKFLVFNILKTIMTL